MAVEEDEQGWRHEAASLFLLRSQRVCMAAFLYLRHCDNDGKLQTANGYRRRRRDRDRRASSPVLPETHDRARASVAFTFDVLHVATVAAYSGGARQWTTWRHSPFRSASGSSSGRSGRLSLLRAQATHHEPPTKHHQASIPSSGRDIEELVNGQQASSDNLEAPAVDRSTGVHGGIPLSPALRQRWQAPNGERVSTAAAGSGSASFFPCSSRDARQSKSSRGLHLRRTPCGDGSGILRRCKAVDNMAALSLPFGQRQQQR
nr:hypothetical protein Iba_chr02eCG6950 [Ipomoea batatas]